MFSSIGWTEMLVIAVVAVIFVGPKDLPAMLRQFGRFSRKARSMAGDFQKQVDDALRESELDSVRDSINEVRSLDPRKAIRDQLNPLKADLEADPNAGRTEAALPKFDEDAGPVPAPPVQVDVEAALARQAELDAAARPKPAPAAKRKPAPRKKAVEGKADAKKAAEKPAARRATARKPAAGKGPVKKVTTGKAGADA